MTIKQLKKQYKDEWILGQVLEENEMREPKKVKVITHSKDREDVYNALLKVRPGLHVATFYTGEIPKNGYAVAFWVYGKRDKI